MLSRAERAAVRAAFPVGVSGRIVLDLGCGAGRVSHPLSLEGAKIASADVSLGMLRAARARFPGLRLLRADAAAVPVRSSTVDLVICTGNVLDCLHPKERRLMAYAEVARVLRPGGRFVLSHHNVAALAFGWHNSMRPHKLRFRARQVLSQRFRLPECYIPATEHHHLPPLLTYYAWPKRFVADLERFGFELCSLHSNSPTLAALQRLLRSGALTRAADPWPYYVFALRSDREGIGTPSRLGAER